LFVKRVDYARDVRTTIPVIGMSPDRRLSTSIVTRAFRRTPTAILPFPMGLSWFTAFESTRFVMRRDVYGILTPVNFGGPVSVFASTRNREKRNE